MSAPQLIPARVISTHYEAAGILSFVLAPAHGGTFDPVEPGSHIDVHLPNGMMRSYSLSNGPRLTGVYRLTVARDVQTKGGSRYMHDVVRAGEVLEISAPRNNFALHEAASLSVLIAGGIGITPFISMASRLNALKRPWRLHYCVRTRAKAALLDELQALASEGYGEIVTNFDEEPGGTMLDLGAVLKSLPADAHVYCCGPIGMLNAFRTRAEEMRLSSDRVHFEYFNSGIPKAVHGGFTVVLQRSGKELVVNEGQSILRAVLESGVQVSFSCEEGVCGACETRIIEGLPDHRDMVLSERERAANETMMICCSGCKSERLVLDL